MRLEFSKATKRAAWRRCGGLCEKCGRDIIGKRKQYDHRQPDAFDGEPTLENCQVLCEECYTIKNGEDWSNISKSNRSLDREAGIRRTRRWR